MCFGDVLALENLAGPGQRPGWMLTLKTRDQNSGTDIVVRNTLLSMNFEEVSTWPIYLGGWTDTRSLWRSKDHQPAW